MSAARATKKRRETETTRVGRLLPGHFALASAAFVALGVAGFLVGLGVGRRPGYGPYRPLIHRWCEAYNVNPDLAAAVLDVESAGRALAVSSAGAVGLMQLMPRTARATARELGLAPPSREDLFSPELNVRLGVYFLSWLRARFGEERAFVIAAYHAGPTRVDEWRRKRSDLSAEEVISELAWPATRRYVGKVMGRWKEIAREGGA